METNRTGYSRSDQFFQGLFQQAEVSLREAIELYRPEQARGETLSYLLTEPSIANCSYRAYNCLLLGDQAGALELSARARLWAEEFGHPHTTAHTYSFEAWLAQVLAAGGHLQQARGALEQDLSQKEERCYWPELLRLKAELCEDLAEAHGLRAQARQLASEQKALWFLQAL